MAIGELQKQAGADTRVTASASLLDDENPPLTGVWRSWEGSDHESGRRSRFSGRPVPPEYDEKTRSETENGRFLSWLVSDGDEPMAPDDADKLARTQPFTDSIPLLSDGTLADDDQRQVHVKPITIGDDGGFAWWASGDNQKAALPRPYFPEDDSPARYSVLARSHAVPDPKPFELDSLLQDSAIAEKTITRSTVKFLTEPGSPTNPGERFHDFSVAPVGLLTNTATGGWRKDLSLLSEAWGQQRRSGQPLFRLTSTSDTSASIPTRSDPYPEESMIYPWATYRGGDNNPPIYKHGPVSSWENLMDWMTYYKRVSASSSGKVSGPTHSVAIDDGGNHFGFIHEVRILPIIARIQWVFSHSAGSPPGNPPRGTLEPRVLVTPVVTMWNPYNVEITSPGTIDFTIPKPLPVALKYTINGRANPNYNAVMAATNNQPSLGGGTLRFRIDERFRLIPGETRLYSPASATPVADNQTITLSAGYRSGGGHYFPVKGSRGERLTLPSSSSIRADAKFDTTYFDGALINPEGVGIYLDMSLFGRRHLVYRMIYTEDIASIVYPPLTNLAQGTLGQCERNPLPFLSTIFGARTASSTHLASKGFVQSSPLVNYTAMGKKDEAERTIARHYGGTAHPVNSPFDYSFVKHAPGGDSLLPNASDRTGRGYIVTGFNKADGLSRCVIAELPTRPVASLGELTNWDMRYENPIPPYAINLIGNSDASPLLPPNAVVNARDSNLTENLQYDDSYCANHLLFDDWFVSSITPDPTDFGTRGRDQQDTYMDFVSGEEPLANQAYRPILEDRANAAAGDARQLYRDHVAEREAWKTIASRLEVEGMFNVNSTSVVAWRALLGHARNLRVPYIREAGATWNADLSGETDHAWSRFSVAADSEAGTPGSSGAFPEATEFAGYRTVDDDFLDALAEEVVDQIRRRGPFLSLSEFVNRQLSSGDLALAGTVQAALNELSKRASTDPFSDLKALSSESLAVPDRAAAAEYRFPEAAEGYSSYGLPGWTRQADILRPLAPVLSARDDTFTIRAHGDARDKDGNILARAVCEATVRRVRDFVDPSEEADITIAPRRPANSTFGRRFEMVSFRWLNPEEI
ncbi:hypothetical protein HAHE_01610 [Haloferula helveola]|uniref:Uncharacterized protein n=2 Tax=Haloferula helveola TaxID=490095 RepID=A0ABM7RA41_9BACT|nr:hypothetical protein HAHE_01610 [Haloferula helveola]